MSTVCFCNADSARSSVGAEAVAVGPDGEQCVLGWDGAVEVFDLGLQFTQRKIMAHGRPVDKEWQLRPGAREEALPPVGAGGSPRHTWPTEEYARHGSPVSAIDISEDGQLAVTGTLNGVVRVWRVGSGELVREVTRGGWIVRAVRFSADGQHVFTVSQIGGPFLEQWEAVEQWNLNSDELVRYIWPGPGDSPYPIVHEGWAAAISRDGRLLVTGGRNGKVVLHDLDARREIGSLVLHGAITCLAIDGRRIVAGTENGEVVLARF
ncbi:WD40 repeat domain-containing protein [Saccharothrix sp. ST-888]|uniref:WD40 repeat domain-containing protein n=1 Tax=Saccharothrix sp. ST-888 TaxID=1427391 RepID=UPI0005EC9F6D|nr:WD40 repeat domain-containing protein [Saccharothrix sp. ST-888]KJK54964.1 hypothetical protein UK12_31630 [Saccharothrix sp. ST-888]